MTSPLQTPLERLAEQMATMISAQTTLLDVAQQLTRLILVINEKLSKIDERVKAVQEGEYQAGLTNLLYAYKADKPESKTHYVLEALQNFTRAAGALTAPLEALQLRAKAQFLAGLCHEMREEPKVALISYWSAFETGLQYETQTVQQLRFVDYGPAGRWWHRVAIEQLDVFHNTFLLPLGRLLDQKGSAPNETQRRFAGLVAEGVRPYDLRRDLIPHSPDGSIV